MFWDLQTYWIVASYAVKYDLKPREEILMSKGDSLFVRIKEERGAHPVPRPSRQIVGT